MTESTTPAPPTPVDLEGMPRHTTPTWEVEMLISGAAVFAVLQLPSWLNQQVFHWLPRLDQDWGGALSTLYIYLMSAAVMLACTFIFHLALRAHWIALVGMHSVFPDGIVWDNARMGPVQRAVEQKRLGSIARAVERADNRATVVFAVGVMLTTMLIVLCLIAALLFAVILFAGDLLGNGTVITITLVAVLFVLRLLFQVGIRYDRRKGAQLSADSRVRCVLAWVFGNVAWMVVGRNSYAWTLLTTNVGRHRVNAAVWLVMLPVLVVAAASILTMQSSDTLGSFGLFPHDPSGARAQHSAYYDDQRDIEHLPLVPYIQSAVIQGPYLRLVVPWQPEIDGAIVRKHCTATTSNMSAAQRASSTLDCLGKWYGVTLDGRPLTTLHYDAGSDPRTHIPALIAMIDVRGLTPGRHQLTVLRPTLEPQHDPRIGFHPNAKQAKQAAIEADTHHYTIAFWH